MPLLQLFQRLPEFRNLLQQFKKSEVSTDNNFRDFNVMDQATGEVKKLEVKPYEQTVAQKVKGGFVRGQGLAMRGGGCAMKGKKRT
jgi:hypothetical protein